MRKQVTLVYMNLQEEANIKRNIPWDDLDPKIMEIVRIANQIKGIATVQSCAGHVKPDGKEFFVENAHLALKFSSDFTPGLLLEIANRVGISDVSFRLFDEGFWVCIAVEPGYRTKLRDFLKAVNDE